MKINLVESIQKNLGYAPLKKIDPNTQEVKSAEKRPDEKSSGQAIIPAVLMALYRFGHTEQGAEILLRGSKPSSWMELFLGDKKQEAVNKVASYSGKSNEETEQEMERISHE